MILERAVCSNLQFGFYFLLHFKFLNYDKPSDGVVTSALATLNWILFFQ